MLPPNRSVPPFAIVPVLTYEDVGAAVEWLTRTFGFAERIRIGDHRAQLGIDGGAVIVADESNGRSAPAAVAGVTHSVLVRVADVEAHHRAARAAGARDLTAPTDHMYGERQYTARDPAGHLWTFTQSITDLAPEDWGGSTVSPW